LGGARDLGQAANAYQLGCDNGLAEGCSALGWFYLQGLGVDRDAVQARELYQKACNLGEKRACIAAKTAK
jgi:TPR repeat protein